MPKVSNRDNFLAPTINVISKRAAFICSNPECRCLTLSPAQNDAEKFVNIGKAAHITAASPGGPRYDSSLTDEERSSVENGIFLCSSCADLVDKNNGIDYSADFLRRWKSEHELWVQENLNKTPFLHADLTVINGTHSAKGKGTITGIEIEGPVIFAPGTKSFVEGEGSITATRISGHKEG